MTENFSRASDLLVPVSVGCMCAFAGAFVGKRMLEKVTPRTVQLVVAAMMLVIGAGLALGIL